MCGDVGEDMEAGGRPYECAEIVAGVALVQVQVLESDLVVYAVMVHAEVSVLSKRVDLWYSSGLKMFLRLTLRAHSTV